MRSIFANLPDEIINIILEDHGGILHREKMIELKKELQKQGIINRIVNVVKGINKRNQV